MSQDFDLLHNDEIVCPKCRAENSDSWEVGFGPSETVNFECVHCAHEFSVTRFISVTYSSYEKKPEAPA